MLCNECGKNEATVHLTHIINGKKSENHLCEECAKKNQQMFNSTFTIENVFSEMLNNAFNKSGYTPTKGCTTCGMTYDQFRKIGKFGCCDCIETFKTKLMPVVKSIQGYDVHVGKIPKRAGGNYKLKKDIEKLKDELKLMVEQEEYEKAAELRDKIRNLEKEV